MKNPLIFQCERIIIKREYKCSLFFGYVGTDIEQRDLSGPGGGRYVS